ncbi:MAG: hypothetical protein LBJ35_03995 [Spirochaetaceae bacterium]|jgi:hypothetical protein|nr:hypothetical protein [Spirochaetaceae bacterium]
MNTKLYCAVTAALLGLAMSCGQGGEDALSLVTTSNQPAVVPGAFALFNGNGGSPASQKINLLKSGEITPVIEFANNLTKEEWIASKGEAYLGYDFIADKEKLGPNWESAGGGGATLN